MTHEEPTQEELDAEYEDEPVHPIECPDGRGYIGRDQYNDSWEKDGVQFLTGDNGMELTFDSRQAAIAYLRGELHFALDDLRFIYWFVNGEDVKRNMMFGFRE